MVIDNLTIDRKLDEGSVTLRLGGELDLANSEQLERELDEAMASATGPVIVDLSGLDFIDSTGLRALVQAEVASRKDTNRLSFIRGRDQVDRVMRLCGLADEFSFLD